MGKLVGTWCVPSGVEIVKQDQIERRAAAGRIACDRRIDAVGFDRDRRRTDRRGLCLLYTSDAADE